MYVCVCMYVCMYVCRMGIFRQCELCQAASNGVTRLLGQRRQGHSQPAGIWTSLGETVSAIILIGKRGCCSCIHTYTHTYILYYTYVVVVCRVNEISALSYVVPLLSSGTYLADNPDREEHRRPLL